MIGETIGNFKIVSRLGRGGMGEVWLAEQQSIGTKVAIKLLSAAISEDTEHVQRFFNEARAVSRIQHAGIVKIFDVGHLQSGSTRGHAYLIMEYLEGETLAQRIAHTKRLPLADLCEIGRQVASVLDATHSAGITHRDLKPDNIFVVPDRELSRGYRVKILDFGIAKLTGTLAGVSPRTTGTMGTPAYMAPEQWGDASKVDWRADLYSLGCVTFEMACGRPPFIVTNIAEACAKHLHDPPPHVRDLVADAPAALDTLVDRLLSKSPTERAESMRDVERTFAGIGTGQPAALAETVAATSSAGQPASSIRPPSGSRTQQGRASASVMQTMPDVARPRRAGMPWPVKAVLAVVVLLLAAGTIKKLTGRRVIEWDARKRGDERKRVSKAEEAQPSVDAGAAVVADAAQVASAPPDAAVAAPAGMPRPPGPRAKPGDKPVKEGTIDADAVYRATFNDRGIQSCYLTAVKKDPTLGGKLTASVWIDEAGHGTKVTATGVSAGVEKCVARRLEAIRFPKPVGGPVLAYIPFSFEPPSPEDLAKGGTLEAHAVDTAAGELRISPSAAEIRAELARIQPKLEECGHGSQGRMQIEIGADGRVVTAHVLSAVAQLTVGTCVEEAVKTNAKFPVSKSGTKMTVSFHLPK